MLCVKLSSVGETGEDDAIHHDFDDMYFNGVETYRGLSLDIGSLITNLNSWIQSLPQTDAEAAQVISKL